MKTALIVSCSENKTPAPGPAIQVYDGPIFRVLRNQLPHVELFILSAKHGLIPAWQFIEPYDQHIRNKSWTNRMIADQWTNLRLDEYSQICLLLGQDYAIPFAEAICDLLDRDNQMLRLATDAKGIGQMQAELVKFCQQTTDWPIPVWHSYTKEKGYHLLNAA